MTSKAWFWPAMLAGAALDLATKHIAFANLGDSQYVNVVPHLLGFVRSENEGALFGMRLGGGLVLAVLSLLAVGLLIYFLHKSKASGAWLPIAYGTIAAGALGNMADRLFNDGRVRDFIDLHIGNHHWPTFNVADVLICIGVGMVIYAEFRKGKRAEG